MTTIKKHILALLLSSPLITHAQAVQVTPDEFPELIGQYVFSIFELQCQLLTTDKVKNFQYCARYNQNIISCDDEPNSKLAVYNIFKDKETCDWAVQSIFNLNKASEKHEAKRPLRSGEVEILGELFVVGNNNIILLRDSTMPFLNLEANDAASFFNKRSRFYEDYRSIRHGIRHNITFTRHAIPKSERLPGDASSPFYYRVHGGIHKDDLEVFILRAQEAIQENSDALNQIIEQRADEQ